MSPKVAVIVVVGLVVVAVLAVVYGGVRPAAGPDVGRDALASTLGRFVRGDPLTFDDLAPGAACADRPDETFVVAAGIPCRVGLPDGRTLTLCSTEGAGALAVVDGSLYPAQRFRADDLGCDAPVTIDVYDRDSILELTCSTGLCRFAVAPADG